MKQKWTLLAGLLGMMVLCQGSSHADLLYREDHGFVHTARSWNTDGWYTLVRDPADTEANPRPIPPDAVLLVTPEGERGGSYGVFYSARHGAWAIYNLSHAILPVGSRFHVQVYPSAPPRSDSFYRRAYVHRATAGNTAGHITYLDRSLVPDDTNLLIFVTANHGVDARGVTVPEHLGVYYDPDRRQWSIFIQRRAPIPVGALFNVVVTNRGPYVWNTPYGGGVLVDGFVHHATRTPGGGGNIRGYRSYIDHPELRDNPRARIFVTPNWSWGPIYYDYPLGVEYYPNSGSWAITNLSRLTMPDGLAFNVLIQPR